MTRDHSARVAKLADAADLGFETENCVSAEIEKTRLIGDPNRPEIGWVHPGEGRSGGKPVVVEWPVDPVEFELARALGKAAEAGRFDVVVQLVKELEARRLTRTTSVCR
jgi:hypothetical protein